MKLLGILLLLGALAYGGWRYAGGRGSAPAQYESITLSRGDITQIVNATGTLNPVINVQVGSQISGNIFKLFADFNSAVTADQVVAQLDPAQYQAIVHQCEGDLAMGRAALELARLTAKRKQDLLEEHAAPQADVDTALATLHQAEATVQIKQANLEKAQVDLDHCTIHSPINGTVISRAVDVGQTVAAAMNAPVLFTIANDLAKMQIDSAVAEADVGNVEVDQDVDFTVDAFPYRTFHGKVVQVRNAATTVQNVVTYDVVISVDNADLKLKPGMTTIISVIIAKRENVLKLPNSALRFRPPDLADAKASPSPGTPKAKPPGEGGEGHRHRGKGDGGNRQERNVYVLHPGEANPAPTLVKLGISDGIVTEVLEGLKEGDTVATGVVATASEPSGMKPSNPLGGGGPRFR
jgi:HlyD family secretion protein